MATGRYDLDTLYAFYRSYLDKLWDRTGRRLQALDRLEFEGWFKGMSKDAQARCAVGWTGGFEKAADSTAVRERRAPPRRSRVIQPEQPLHNRRSTNFKPAAV